MRRALAFPLLMVLACAVALPGCRRGDASRPETAETTLAAVRERGYVRCGASPGTVGFSAPDQDGRWRGLDADTCRAIAAAVLGDQDKVRFVPLTGQQRLTALQTGEIDVLPRTTTWTLSRDANGINFTLPNYYDYDGILVPRRLGIRTPAGLDGASVCLQTGSTTEVAFAALTRTVAPHLRAVVFDSTQASRQAFLRGRCDALMSDASGLASVRATATRDPQDYVIIRANGNVSPLTPSVRHGDDQWFDIVKWSFQAMLVAEELGITRDNAQAMRASDDPRVKRFLGAEPGIGRALGLDDGWAFAVVSQVGNYGEVFERNVGRDSLLKIERGPNRLSRDGGLMVPMAFD